MTSKLVQDGMAMEYLNQNDPVLSGDLIERNHIVAIAYDDIATDATGTLLTQGVFTITKAAHAAGGFTQGDSVYLTSGGQINNTSAGDQYVGIAWASSATSDTTVEVNINFGPSA